MANKFCLSSYSLPFIYVLPVCALLGNAACMLVKVENLLLKCAFPLLNSATAASYALSLHGFPASIPEKEREMYVYDEGKRKKEKMAAKSLPKGKHISCMARVFFGVAMICFG
jgi:hypothetical protein